MESNSPSALEDEEEVRAPRGPEFIFHIKQGKPTWTVVTNTNCWRINTVYTAKGQKNLDRDVQQVISSIYRSIN